MHMNCFSVHQIDLNKKRTVKIVQEWCVKNVKEVHKRIKNYFSRVLPYAEVELKKLVIKFRTKYKWIKSLK